MAGYLIVDGYNIINSWSELKSIQKDSLEDARDKLMEYLENYRAYKDMNVVLVFDAHLTPKGKEKHMRYGGIEVVYTKENETADSYIERLIDEIGKLYYVIVATSDWLEQQVVLGRGAARISARELHGEIMRAKKAMGEKFSPGSGKDKNTIEQRIDKDILEILERMRRER